MPTEVSVELSWEEVRPYICEYFDLVEEEEKIARYAGNTAGLSVNRYRCIFFVARLACIEWPLHPSAMLHVDPLHFDQW